MHYTICDYMLDLFENSVEAESSLIAVDFLQDESDIRAYIADNGKGMTEEQLAKVRSPFYTDGEKHPERKVGFGIPFIVQAVEITGGTFDIDSHEGEGTSIFIRFPLSHIDCPPVGDVVGTFLAMLSKQRDCEIVIRRTRTCGGKESGYTLVRSDMIQTLGNIEEASNLALMQRYIRSQEEELCVSGG